MSLAQKGFNVVNFNYRLAPEHKFPDQLKDINSVMKFVCGRAGEHWGDLDNVFFVGDSAGAQMASQYLAAVTNPNYAQMLGLDVPAFTVRAAAGDDCRGDDCRCDNFQSNSFRRNNLRRGGCGAVTARIEYRGAIAIDREGVVHFTVIKHSDVVGDAESRCHRSDAAEWRKVCSTLIYGMS